ncbi:MAG: minor capsid protein [Candidatus Riflebacteria bacterium]|nr:minor capsid protein [Candidatus Riflebacteria bacterium]
MPSESDLFNPSFELPPEKALEFFINKGLKETFSYLDMMHDAHSTSFTVAKMLDMDLLNDVKKAMTKVMAEGQTFKKFADELIPILVSKGWWGKGKMVDPVTGEEKDVQLGSVRRLKTVFLTNMRASLMAGQWADIQENKRMFPYLMYDAVKDNRTRPQHRAWDGLVLEVDDPWWKTHYPPNGWNCRCDVIQMNQRMLEKQSAFENKKDPNNPIKSGPDKAPNEQLVPWKNPRTGETIMVPQGIDPAFAYNVGESQAKHLNQTFEEKAKETEKEFKLPENAIQLPEAGKPGKSGKDNSDYENIIKTVLPKTKVDLNGVDPKASEAIVNSIIKAKSSHHELEEIESIKVGDLTKEKGYAQTKGKKVTLDKEAFSDYEKLLKEIKKSVKAGEIPEGCGNVEYIIDHELGHILTNLKKLSHNAEVINYFYKNVQNIRTGLSKYAGKYVGQRGVNEFLAEAFAELQNNLTPRGIAAFMKKWF